MNKHKNFIKKAYNGELGLTMCQEWKNKILENYPEFKEEELKIGDWVVLKNKRPGTWNYGGKMDRYLGSLQRIRKIGINRVCFDGPETEIWGFLQKDIERKATKEEITEHLIAEADRRCLVSGAGIKPLKDWFYGIGNSMVIGHECNYIYYPSNDTLIVESSNSYNICLYSEGKWAEILNTMTKSEAEQRLNELGVNVKIVD